MVREGYHSSWSNTLRRAAKMVEASDRLRYCNTRSWPMSASGHSRPSHPAPTPTDVRYAPRSDRNIAAPRLVAMCTIRRHRLACCWSVVR